MVKISDKKNEILDSAQALIQERGYNGFSYADISATVGIRKASIHHYFPTKADLVVAVVKRYTAAFHDCLLNINTKSNWLDKIKLYITLYKNTLGANKLCLCGMLAADRHTLPVALREVICDFFDQNEQWLMQVLRSHYVSFSKERLFAIAWQIINTLQGGIMMGCMLKNPLIFSASCEALIAQLNTLSP